MKNTLTSACRRLVAGCLFLTPFLLAAQNSVAEWLGNQTGPFQEMPLFQLSDEAQNHDNAPENATFLEIDQAILRGLHQNSPDAISVFIPSADGNDFELRLARVEIFAPDFKITRNDGQPADPSDYPKGIFYRGIVDGDETSTASFSIFENDVQAMILTGGGGSFFLEKNGPASPEFIFFESANAPNPHARACEGLEIPNTPTVGDSTAADRGVGCKVVSIFFECDYQMFLDKGSVANVTAYVSGLFSQISALYANDNIAVQISAMNVWSAADPYQSLTSTSAVLNSFQAAKGTAFTGDLAHFLTTRSLGGGIAYVDVLCLKSYAFGVSQVYNSYSNVPAYSWSVEVVTHELGHNFGAWHTHSCNWPGGPIDNCYTPEGGCAVGPAPVNGGTIMSYCHLTATGINFSLGFGAVAGDHIRSKTVNSSCLAQTGTAPTTFSTANLTASGVQLNWGAVGGATNYQVQFKPAASSFWANAGMFSATSTSLSGLAAATNYQWQVKTDCSVWSASQNFTTGGAAAVCSAPSNLTTTAISTSGATISWSSVAGAANYSVQYKTAAATTWTTVAAQAGTSLNLTGLQAATSYNWLVKADCSGNASQISFTTSTSSATSCSKPTGMKTPLLLPTTAMLSWNLVAGATSYTVKYKLKSASSYTTLPSVSTTSQSLSGLLSGKQYNWQVKANCSSFTSTQNFTPPSALPEMSDETGILPSERVLVLAPNPIGNYSGELKIRLNRRPTAGSKLLLCDAAGRSIQQLDFTTSEMELPVADLPVGFYSILIFEDGHRVAAQRFVRIE